MAVNRSAAVSSMKRARPESHVAISSSPVPAVFLVVTGLLFAALLVALGWRAHAAGLASWVPAIALTKEEEYVRHYRVQSPPATPGAGR
jgi:membrane associated rhomboid family serine protease